MSTPGLAPTAPSVEDPQATWIARLRQSPGDRPAGLELLSADGPVWCATSEARAVVFDGVLHNRAEIEEALGPQPDLATLALKGYERWGLDLLTKLKGFFTVVLWDGDRDLAVLARDPLGIQPIFHTERAGELLISTSIDVLLAAEGVSNALNRQALADHLCQRWPDREETYFEAIRRVPQCHALIMERGARRLHRYWDPAPPGEEMNWVAEDELERFHDLFDQAVNRCIALGPTAIYLSGGLDSVSVAGVAADNCRAQGRPDPLALSLVFPDPEANEELPQRAVARDLGLDQVIVRLDDAVGQKGLLLSACDSQAGRPAPTLNYWAAGYGQLAKAARARGITGVLTGNGGDEWLCVTPLYAADLLRSRDVRGLMRHAGAQRRSFNISAAHVWRNALWTFGARPILASAVGRALWKSAPWAARAYRRNSIGKGVPQWVAPDAALKADIIERGVNNWPERPTDGWYRWDMRYGLDHGLSSLEMEEHYANRRHTGLRNLSPFLDADLVEFLYRVPPDLLDRGGRSKGLVRDELTRRFPELGFERHKKVSARSFIQTVASEEGPRAWKELGGIQALAELEVIDPKILERELPTFFSGRSARESSQLCHILNLESWTRSRT